MQNIEAVFWCSILKAVIGHTPMAALPFAAVLSPPCLKAANGPASRGSTVTCRTSIKKPGIHRIRAATHRLAAICRRPDKRYPLCLSNLRKWVLWFSIGSGLSGMRPDLIAS